MIDSMLQTVKQFFPEFLNSYCIINGAPFKLDTIEKMGFNDFSYKSRLSVPQKIYKYFPNKEISQNDGSVKNYSLDALKNNTVFLQSPSNFDDCYDSDISIDYALYEKLTLLEYCRRCGISVNIELNTKDIGNTFLSAILKSLYKHHNYQNIFTTIPLTEQERLENELFCTRLHIEMQSTDDLGKAVSKILTDEYNDLQISLKSTFRVSCFATSPFSQLMWGGSYADEHKGFCLEYTVFPNDDQYKDIFYNLFPMIYCKIRSDISEKIISMKGKNITEEMMWNIYFHGALRKSIDWCFQNEWRLLLPFRHENIKDYNIKFFPITKVFLGNCMPIEKSKEIITICSEKNIPCVGVKKSKDFFEMQESEIKND